MNAYKHKSIVGMMVLGGLVLPLSGCSLFNDNIDRIEQTPKKTEIAEVVVEENKSKEMMPVSTISTQIEEEYIASLKEDERYLITYDEDGIEENVMSVSGNSAIKLSTIDELKDRVEKSKLDFYIPEYIPEGFRLNDIGIHYYLNYDNLNLSMIPIREEELKEGAVFKVYKMSENYKESIERIYLQYTDGENTITYRFGLSFSNGYDNGEENNQFLKEEYDYALLPGGGNFRVNQKIEPKEVFTGIPGEGHYNSPDCFESIEMDITIEEPISEEILKIANSIYKVN